MANKIHKILQEEKDKLNQMEVPEELEGKLLEALEKTPKKNNKRFYKRIAIIILIFLIIGPHIDTVAYYTGKFVGYEPVMTGTLQKLNEMGKGQSINKSYSFSDGASITLDGIMLDDNGVNLFYVIKAPSEDIEEVSPRMTTQLITGFQKRFSGGGAGETNKENNEQKWIIQTHGAPSIFDNKMKLGVNYTTKEGNGEYAEIPFTLDRRKALGKSLRIRINKEVSIDNSRNIKIKSLTASPTTTVIKGQIQNIFQLGFDHITNNRFYPDNIEMALYANGKEVPLQGSGMSTNMKGIHYELIFDALPEDTQEIEITFVSFQGRYEISKEMGSEESSAIFKKINKTIFKQKMN
ncbi:uncharacterized protein DUF4179 [Alkalibaculum bacchi]|uniref:Uncharacterized protein DUF4179 n=1 Tax=Alkalibaculum bacchi TaxID=645887 RepID=A0A366I531_9FIRM|nr:DUF4179 domain-containing protein [Alkalibaculum bacchi]RBP63349.1 uncharacterized protein DUF4179 [Alkalibaculum bacchi]